MKLLNQTITSAAIAMTAALSCLVVKAEASTLKFGESSTSNVGLTTSQGVEAMKADIARKLYGVDGSGVIVGVISDSFNYLGGAESDVASGDLPSGIKVLQDFPDGFSDEGRAIMQLVYDVAPGANFAFHVPSLSPDRLDPAEYANAIFKLADAGAKIIVSDVGDSGPMFQDGIVARAIDAVASRPGNSAVSFFAAAGNSRRRSYESAFNPSGVIEPLNGGEFHDFNPGIEVDTLQSITIPSNTQVLIDFQWDSPFFSVSGGAGSPNDLDILLYDSSGTNVLASSTASNIGKDPVEELLFFNEAPLSEFNLAISKNAGSNPGLLKYIVTAVGQGSRDFKINEFDTASSTIFGYANAQAAATVGAASYLETPAFGTEPARLRSFSSVGCTPILFDTAGNRLASPECRLKPAFVAPDGGNTTFFGSDIPEDADDFPNFPGTSASVAHAAAVAALLLDADPTLSPAEIYKILAETALDMDDPSTPEFDVGFDFATGYGLIQADRALSRVKKSVPEPSLALGMLALGTLGAVSVYKRKLKKDFR